MYFRKQKKQEAKIKTNAEAKYGETIVRVRDVGIKISRCAAQAQHSGKVVAKT